MKQAVTGLGLMLVGGALSCNALAADWAEVGEALADGASSNLYLGVNNKTRTEWYRKDGDGNDWGQDATATETQATVGVDFRSAYLGGLVGFDVAALGRIRLNSDYPTDWAQYDAGMKVLKQKDCYYTGKNGDGNYVCDGTEGATGITEVTLKTRGGEGKNTFDLRAGLGMFAAGMISSSDEDDVLPTSYTGFDLDARLGGTRIEYAWINGVKNHNDSSVQDISAKPNYSSHYDYTQLGHEDDLKIDYVHSLGLSRKFGGLLLEAAASDAPEYLRRYMISADYILPFNKRENLQLKAQFYQNHNYGDVWELEKEIYPGKFGDIPDHTRLSTYTIAWTESLFNSTAWTVALHHTRIGEGGFSYGIGNVKGVLKNEGQGNYQSMRRSNEQVWAVENTLDFSHSRNPWLKGFEVKYGFHYGMYYEEDPREGSSGGAIGDTHESEHAITARYVVRKGTLKGLSVNLQQAFVDDEGHKFGQGKINQTKFDISYTMPLM